MQELYILPFDHRGSFLKMLGFSKNELTAEQTQRVCDYKHVIFEAFLLSLQMGVLKEKAAVLVDEQFGLKIHQEAEHMGITHILTAEKSGQDEFDFEYGNAFGDHIERIDPDYVKVLVRYNPLADRAMNLRQCDRLKILNDYCKSRGYKFLFELLAVPTPEQMSEAGNDKETYEQSLRWRVMVESIKELQSRGIEPDIWKIEGLNDTDQMQAVIETTRRQSRDKVGVVVLGRGESEEKVKTWLSVAAKIPGVVGFAVGRTVFKQPLLDFYEGKIDRQSATQKIAQNFKGFVDLFSEARTR
ncbi:MAG: DUF2090 domain-containing protein [Parcubacteria group bacterium]|nr:DUF2090 domain-containing protein [Parcubacteria group bacterium]